MTHPSSAQSAESSEIGPDTVARPAWLLAREVLRRRGTLALLAGGVCASVLARSLQPLGISASRLRGTELDAELMRLVFGALSLLVLVRATHWRRLMHGFGTLRLFAIVCASGFYLHCIVCLCVSLPNMVLFAAGPPAPWSLMALSLWLSTLAAILALSRLEPRILGLSFLLLVAWVPVFGIPRQAAAGALATGIPPGAWSADEFLPMLTPHLLALGYLCCE